MLDTVQCDRGREYWTPTLLLDGATVFLLGGGPSLQDFDVECLRGRRVMAINTSAYLCPWAEFLYFTDNNWFDDNRPLVEAWPGTVITGSRVAKGKLPDKLLRIEVVNRPDFPHGERTLKFGRSSGHTAISLSISMGASRVVLLGYDMQRVDGRSHYHDVYGTEDDKLFSHDFVPAFTGWNDAALRAGAEVINCTPGSALTEFAMCPLAEVLAE